MNKESIEARIRLRAFEIYEWRIENEIPGSATSDWLEAEIEILEQREVESKYK